MALSPTERIMARRQIGALIDADPVDIILTRTPRVSDGAGGFLKGTPQELEPQTVTIIPFKRRMSEYQVNTELGDVIDYPYLVLGDHNLDIQRGDTFSWQGNIFEVHAIEVLEREVRIAAAVDYFGGPRNG